MKINRIVNFKTHDKMRIWIINESKKRNTTVSGFLRYLVLEEIKNVSNKLVN
jgi:hypothetical protein